MRNRVNYAFFIVSLVVVLLLVLSGIQIPRADILSDMRPDEKETTLPNSLQLQTNRKKAFVADTCKYGVNDIEDYGDSLHTGMESFYKAILQCRKKPRNVRIAFFGDSFIEGDVLTGELRKLLQKKFGGSGIGWIDMSSPITGFRSSVEQTCGGWDSHSRTDSAGFHSSLQGIAERYFVPLSSAYTGIRLHDHITRKLDTCDVATLYFKTHDAVTIRTSINGGKRTEETLIGGDVLQQKKFYGRIHQIRWNFSPSSINNYFFGAALEGAKGISLDNFSLRGSSGASISRIPLEHLKQLAAMRPYDLIIMEYGVNVVTKDNTNYHKYQEAMKRTIHHLHEAFPHTGILIVSVADRCAHNNKGEMKTMLGIKGMLRYQQAIASENHIAFWNLHAAMGGDESMVKLVKEHKANLDYTHINYRGGKVLADLFYKALLQGVEGYEKKLKYDK